MAEGVLHRTFCSGDASDRQALGQLAVQSGGNKQVSQFDIGSPWDPRLKIAQRVAGSNDFAA